MKPLLRLLALLLLSVTAHGQWYTVTHTTGTVLHGTTNVTVVGAGTASSYTLWCAAGPYWIGAGTGSTPDPGSYLFTFSRPVNAFEIRVTAADPGESLTIDVNGVRYAIVSGHFIPFVGCGTSAIPLSGDSLLSTGSNSERGLRISYCPINSVRVATNGVSNGSVFTFIFSDTGGCFSATSNIPCVGDTLRLGATTDSSGASYLWSGPLGFTSTSRTPFRVPSSWSDTGWYRVVRTIGTFRDTAYTRVSLRPLPVITASNNSPLCIGLTDTLFLRALPGATGETYSWRGPAGFTSTLQFPQINGFLPINAGVYTVTATSLYGCRATATTTATLAPLPPRPVISGTRVYCQGDTFIPFTISATGTVLWYNTGSGGVGSSTAGVVNTAIPGTTTWWASQTVAGCESLRDSITVLVNPTPPPPVISGTNNFCQFFPYIPPTAAGPGIRWYTTATGGVGTAMPPFINTTIPGATPIYATQTVAGCESPRATFLITVNPKPPIPVIVNNPGNYCVGQLFVAHTILSGTGILWYAADSGGVGSSTSPYMSTATTGRFTVWASQTVLGCESDRIPVSITVFDNVTADFDFEVNYGCKADTVVFTNRSSFATDFVWEFGDLHSSVLADPVHVYRLEGVYPVKLKVKGGVCFDSITKNISLLHPLKAEFATDTTLICQGGRVTFSNSSSAISPAYTWSFGDGTISNLATPPAHTYTLSGIYSTFLTVSDFRPCTDTMFKTIVVDTVSELALKLAKASDTFICKGSYMTLKGTYASWGNTGITWRVSNGDVITNQDPLYYAFGSVGVYTITATAHYRSCPEPIAQKVFTVAPQPALYIGDDTSICPGGAPLYLVDNINNNNPRAKWRWSTGATTPGITVSEPGKYAATVQIDGCAASTEVEVLRDCYMDLPNVFTPNGDGLNDYFYPRNELTSGLVGFHMEILNRWGQKIFETNELEGRGWDGRFNGLPQPQGVYIYMLEGTYKDGNQEKHTGNVTLLR